MQRVCRSSMGDQCAINAEEHGIQLDSTDFVVDGIVHALLGDWHKGRGDYSVLHPVGSCKQHSDIQAAAYTCPYTFMNGREEAALKPFMKIAHESPCYVVWKAAKGIQDLAQRFIIVLCQMCSAAEENLIWSCWALSIRLCNRTHII